MNDEDLIPAKKGEVRNPEGMKPGTKHGMRAQLNRLLKKDANVEKLKEFEAKLGEQDDKSIGNLMSLVLIEMGLKGDMVAIKEVLAQTELPHPKNVQLTGDFNVTIPPKAAKCL